MQTDHITENLTAEQARAVTASKGPLAVIAGPGTGKTKVLAHRAAYLLKNPRIHPDMVKAVTFTTRAGNELSSRIAGLINGSRLPFAGTFHAFGISFLKRFAPASFQLLSPVEQHEFAKKLWPSAKKTSPQKIVSRIVHLKELGLGVEAAGEKDPEAAAWYKFYEEAKQEQGLFDLTDLILKPVQLLRADENIRSQANAQWPFILVDEFQDVNPLQLELVILLGGNGSGVFVIGDQNQAIYAFRGACTYALGRLSSVWPGLKTVKLFTNWRSSQVIIKASKEVLDPPGRDYAGQITAVREEGPRIVISSHSSPKAEATWATKMIESLIGGSSHFTIDSGWAGREETRELSFGDIAVLYRTNAMGDLAEEVFRQSGLPFRRIRAKAPAEQEQVASFIEEIRSTMDPDHTADAIPSCFKDRELPAALKELVQRASNFKPTGGGKGTVREFLWSLSCLRAEDTYVPGEHVSLMTMHAAKGLEFEAVFVIGAGKGLLPIRSAKTIEELGEEKRLLYVSLTRAKSRLFVSYFQKGQAAGQSAQGELSPLLKGIPESLTTIRRPKKTKKARSKWKQLDLFQS